MWAAGIVLFMLLTGSHPFETGGSTFYLLEQIMNGKQIVEQALFGYDDISEEAKDLILLLLNRDPLERLSARTALKHPWFSLKLTTKSVPLDLAADKMKQRRETKIQRPHEYQNSERITMKALTDEILRYGIDAQQ